MGYGQLFLKPISLNNGPLRASKQYSKNRKAVCACKEEKPEKFVTIRNIILKRRKNLVSGYILLSTKLVQNVYGPKIYKIIHFRDENKKERAE